MKFGTSFYNGTALKKDITRNFPLWGLYTLGMVLVVLQGFDQSRQMNLVDSLDRSLNLFSLMNFGYALLAAALLFGDLFKSRLCNALHAMPLRREGWFAIHITAGILFCLVPNALVCLLLLPRLGTLYWQVAFWWAGVLTLQYLFFFGTAVFSVMCAGNYFGMVLMYGIVNFLPAMLNLIILSLYEPLLYGIRFDPDFLNYIFPLGHLMSNGKSWFPQAREVPLPFDQTDWAYLLSIVGVGVILAVIALLLYRRRRLESAGDFIAVKPIKPVFLILYTLMAGIVVYLIGGGLMGRAKSYLFLAVGVVAGYFTGQMLLQRRVKVFQAKSLIGFAVLAAVLFGSIFIVRMDLPGVVDWVPRTEQVQSVYFTCGAAYNGQLNASDPENIARIMELHEDLIQRGRPEDSYRSYGIEIKYTLKDGTTRARQYTAPRMKEWPLVQKLTALMSKPEYVFSTEAVDDYVDQVQVIRLMGSVDQTLSGEQARSLMKALVADCRAGTMAQTYDVHPNGDVLDLEIYTDDENSKWIRIWEDNTNALQWLWDHGIQLENNIPETEKN